MDTVVLDPGVTDTPGMKVYAQCMKGQKGGVTVLAMNIDPVGEHTLTIPLAADRYKLTAPEIASQSVLLNGVVMQVLRMVRSPESTESE